jgi:hypothetical protein
MWRAKRTSQAKRQIEAQHHKAAGSQRLRNRHQQFHFAIAARSMGQHNAIPIRLRRLMHEPANHRLRRGILKRRKHGETLPDELQKMETGNQKNGKEQCESGARFGL